MVLNLEVFVRAFTSNVEVFPAMVEGKEKQCAREKSAKQAARSYRMFVVLCKLKMGGLISREVPGISTSFLFLHNGQSLAALRRTLFEANLMGSGRDIRPPIFNTLLLWAVGMYLLSSNFL